jgi:hypothetical protein
MNGGNRSPIGSGRNLFIHWTLEVQRWKFEFPEFGRLGAKSATRSADEFTASRWRRIGICVHGRLATWHEQNDTAGMPELFHYYCILTIIVHFVNINMRNSLNFLTFQRFPEFRKDFS